MENLLMLFDRKGKPLSTAQAASYRALESLLEFGRSALYQSGDIRVGSMAIESGRVMEFFESKGYFDLPGYDNQRKQVFKDHSNELFTAIFNRLFRCLKIEISDRDGKVFDKRWNAILSDINKFRKYCTVGETYQVQSDDEYKGQIVIVGIARNKNIRKEVVDFCERYSLPALGDIRPPRCGHEDDMKPFLDNLLRSFVGAGVLCGDDNVSQVMLDMTTFFGRGDLNDGVFLIASGDLLCGYKPEARYNNANHIRIEEHTAQIDISRGAQYQQAFSEGRINVLSCSTTFEMGIDVGSLPRVMMMNTPPATSNYKQRAGRAGRRPGAAPYILTFAGNDFAGIRAFAQPWTLYNGPITPPMIYLSRPTFWSRHLRAEALHDFLCWWQDFNEGNMEEYWNETGTFFFGRRYNGKWESNSRCGKIVSRLVEWASSENGKMCATQCAEFVTQQIMLQEGKKIVPHSVVSDLVFQFLGFDTGLEPPFERKPDNLSEYQGLSGPVFPTVDKESGLLVEDDNSLRQCVCNRLEMSVKGISDIKKKKNFYNKQSVDRFSEANIVPRYGFPVDTISLDFTAEVPRRNEAPQRDFRTALFEYAPDRNVYLDKQLYRVRDFKTDDDFDSRRMRYCKHCDALLPGGSLVSTCPECGNAGFDPISAVKPTAFIAGFADSSRQGAQGTRIQLYSGRMRHEPQRVKDLALWVAEPDTQMMDFYNPGFKGEGYKHNFRGSVGEKNVALYQELITDITLFVLPDITNINGFGGSEVGAELSQRAKNAIRAASLILRRVLVTDILCVSERDVGVCVKHGIECEDGEGAIRQVHRSVMVLFDLAQGGGGAVLPISKSSPSCGENMVKAVDTAIALCKRCLNKNGVVFDMSTQRLEPQTFAEWRNLENANLTEGKRLQCFDSECFSPEDTRRLDGLDIPDALVVLERIKHAETDDDKPLMDKGIGDGVIQSEPYDGHQLVPMQRYRLRGESVWRSYEVGAFTSEQVEYQEKED
jgi:hypothetical protein